jgi:hypothetical protein
MPARLAQQGEKNGLMEGRVPTSPIVRHHEQGVGGPLPSNLSQFVDFSCHNQPHGRDFLRSLPCQRGWHNKRMKIGFVR